LGVLLLIDQVQTMTQPCDERCRKGMISLQSISDQVCAVNCKFRLPDPPGKSFGSLAQVFGPGHSVGRRESRLVPLFSNLPPAVAISVAGFQSLPITVGAVILGSDPDSSRYGCWYQVRQTESGSDPNITA